MPFARRVAATCAASTPSAKSIVPTTSERLARIGDERRRVRRRPRPSRRARPRTASCARTHQSRPPLREHPVQLLGEQHERRERGRVERLVLARVGQRGAEAEELGDPAIARGDLLDALDRGRAEQREPEAAVGGEALLRREVVGIGLRGVERQAAGAGGRVDQDERVAAVGGRSTGDHHAGRRLVVRPADRVGAGDRRPAAARRRAPPPGSPGRRGRAPLRGDVGELAAELAERQVQRAIADERQRGRVPEGGRAAVAERDLVAVGRAEQLRRRRCARGRRARAPASGGARCPAGRAWSPASAASCSGRTFEGPQPKRPSEGLSAAGMCSCVLVVMGRRPVVAG